MAHAWIGDQELSCYGVPGVVQAARKSIRDRYSDCLEWRSVVDLNVNGDAIVEMLAKFWTHKR
jgi:hypothetical protein